MMQTILTVTSIAIFLIAHQNGQLILCSEDDSQVEVPIGTNEWSAFPQDLSDKLPNTLIKDENSICHDFLGCVQILPINLVPNIKFVGTARPSDPNSLETEFILSDRKSHMPIRYEKTRICLTDPKLDRCKFFPYNIDKLMSSPFDRDRRTIILIGGYHSKKNCSWHRELAELWPKIEDVNLIRVMWTGGNGGYYPQAAANTRIMARQITVLLHYLAELHGTSLKDERFLENIYIIGHSLGAHAAGFVGQDLDGKIGRITGLDPAGPDFHTTILDYRLDRTDAIFVDVIHTNAGSLSSWRYGTTIDSGHIDIYANDGINQPGCGFFSGLRGCSHKLATTFYHLFLKHAYDSAHMVLNNSNDPKNSKEYKANRLRAYKADTFDELALGRSLAELCPITSLKGTDLTNADLPRCSIPIDFTAKPKEYKKELTTMYGMNLNSYNDSYYSIPINRYFFRTFANQSDQSFHYLLRVVVAKKGFEEDARSKGCEITVEIDRDFDEKLSLIANGPYKLLEYGDDLYEILIPFIVVDPATKTHILTLEYDNYYEDVEDQISRLKESLLKIMPKMVVLSDMKVSKERKESSGMAGWWKSITEVFTWEGSPRKNCDLPIESMSIEVMKTSRRHQIAYYSYNKVPEPDLSIIDTNYTAQYKLERYEPVSTSRRSTFFLNKVIVGPSI